MRDLPSRFESYIDHPTFWTGLPRQLLVRGWCFATDGRVITGIRLVLPDQMIPGIVGLPRPDVRIALPHAPSDNTGFELRATVPAGRYGMRLEARLADGSWHLLAAQPVTIRRDTWLIRLSYRRREDLIAFQLPAHPVHAPRPIRRTRLPVSPRPAALGLAIVTPSYQQGAFLDETIRSVLHHAPASLQYVVQDGGSTDGSVDVIARWARKYSESGGRSQEAGNAPSTTLEPPVSSLQSPASGLQSPASAQGAFVWASEADSGQADAIAKGFAKTSGRPDDLMAWINSDDFYLPGALGFVADYFARHPEVDVIYGHRILVDENSQEIGRWFLPKHDPEVLRLNDFVPQETMFWRRRIWDKVGGLDTSFKFAMDWDLLLRFQAAGAKIVRVPYFLACFRIHSAQKTSAQMQSVGQAEITRLRERTFGRVFPPQELETNPTLLRYLRRSAFIEFLWKLGIRAP
jgi:glycosyltransferase involved in cell wall biosynthesis